MTHQSFGRWNPHRPSCGCVVEEKMADCESSLGLSMLVGKRAFVKYSRNRIRLFGDVYDEEYELDYNVTKSCRGISYFYLKKDGHIHLVGNGKEIYAGEGLVNGGSVADSGPYEGETERLGAIRRFITVHQPHDPSARIEMFYCDDYSTPKGIYLASQDRATAGDLYSVGYMTVVNPYASPCKVLYKDVGTQTLTGSGNHSYMCNGGNALVPENGNYSALYWKNETSTHRWESPYLVCGTHYAQIGSQAFYEGGDIAVVKTDHSQTSANRIVTQNESAAIMAPDRTVGLYRYGYKVQTYPTTAAPWAVAGNQVACGFMVYCEDKQTGLRDYTSDVSFDASVVRGNYLISMRYGTPGVHIYYGGLLLRSWARANPYNTDSLCMNASYDLLYHYTSDIKKTDFCYFQGNLVFDEELELVCAAGKSIAVKKDNHLIIYHAGEKVHDRQYDEIAGIPSRNGVLFVRADEKIICVDHDWGLLQFNVSHLAA